MKHKKIARSEALTPGDRMNYALHTLGIKWKDAAAAMANVTMTMLSLYLSNKKEIPEFRLDLLLLNKGVSKKFVLLGEGEPLATIDEQLDLVHLEMVLLNKVVQNIEIKDILTRLTGYNPEELVRVKKYLVKIEKERPQSSTRSKAKK
ncbi:hypothetical protein EHO61_07665 [Leptospira fluminis]|uniref:Uncharacterized protein n=1 Tax=Leptospira fluminis TaxID=2484979 RepID=A0A4R9GQM9_9LEPT|nr:hypothetical protein [Leptospira fluminis]TGK19340.1 hypothetical protein EHO61_07665 [Leptospira fluminis]